jgi:hypothetical protein
MLNLELRAGILIGWITVITGGLQIIIPSNILPIIGVTADPVNTHLLATVGMFMVLFGAATIRAINHPEEAPIILFWSGCQKMGAVLLMAWGVYKGVFSPLALLVASFDLASGLLYFHIRSKV